MRARCPGHSSCWLTSPCHPVPAQVWTKHLKPPKDSQRLVIQATCDPYFFFLLFDIHNRVFPANRKIHFVAKLHSIRILPTHSARDCVSEFQKAPILELGPMCQVSYHLSRVYFNCLVGPPRQFYLQPSLHALAQLHQGLVEGVDADKPQTRIFDIENDVNRNHHDERKAKYV